MNPGSDIGAPRASSPTGARPVASRSMTARRVGSASAANTLSSRAGQ
jgi:hypothetical protein